jgi:hypothetical protein
MFTKKSELTVKEAVKLAYDAQPEIWHSIIFVADVRRLLGRPGCKDGTIDRRLRELRQEDKVINYKCINNDLAIYKKLPVKHLA